MQPENASAESPLPDFHSPEFNRIDELDDNRENYRTFQSLDGVVTADMLYHAERKKAAETSFREDKTAGSGAAKSKAQEESSPPDLPPPLTIASKGRTLIIGSELEQVLDCGEKLSDQGLKCTLCVLADSNSLNLSLSRTPPFALVEAASADVSGSFGSFSVKVGPIGDQVDLSLLLGDDTGYFDLVLDLQASPSYCAKQLPLGYYAPGHSRAGLDEALSELPEMRGRFTRPQFTMLLADRCLHGRSRKRDCRLCLETCPIGAITSTGSTIAIDPYLCQGCGACSLVCPADAIRMQAPTQEEILSELGRIISAAGNSSPDLIVHDSRMGDRSMQSLAAASCSSPLVFKIDEIGRFGTAVMLTALAKGAGSVTLVAHQDAPEPVKAALQRQGTLVSAILGGLNIPADRVRVLFQSDKDIGPTEFTCPSRPVEPLADRNFFAATVENRDLIRQAAHYLQKTSATKLPAVSLPADAPFGAVAIKTDACSLCMACAGTCPTKALAASGEEPRLSFTESRCHQCGHCAAACPENAIALQPRLLYDAEAAGKPVVLHEVEPFKCIECGLPFASQTMVSRMQDKLKGHWMYSSDRQIRRLQMCRTCRTRDSLTAGDYR